MKAVIILCCEGRQDNGFKFCSSVSNIILDLEGLTHKPNYLGLIEYLDKTVNIFDAVCYKSNVVMNAIYKIYELNFVSEELYLRLSDFYKFHSKCGIILRAEPK